MSDIATFHVRMFFVHLAIAIGSTMVDIFNDDKIKGLDQNGSSKESDIKL